VLSYREGAEYCPYSEIIFGVSLQKETHPGSWKVALKSQTSASTVGRFYRVLLVEGGWRLWTHWRALRVRDHTRLFSSKRDSCRLLASSTQISDERIDGWTFLPQPFFVKFEAGVFGHTGGRFVYEIIFGFSLQKETLASSWKVALKSQTSASTVGRFYRVPLSFS